MYQIFYGDNGHKERAEALAAITPGSAVAKADAPALDTNAAKLHTLIFWGHGDAHGFCGMNATAFAAKVKEWVKKNPLVKTVEIITCNSRHGTETSKKVNGVPEVSWVKSFTDQCKPLLKAMGLEVKSLPMGIGATGACTWSVLKWSATTKTWMYVTAGGATDADMWVGVLKVEDDPLFVAAKNYATVAPTVKAKDTARKYTMDSGTVSTLRPALVTLA